MNKTNNLLIRNAHLIDKNTDAPGAVLVRGGKIAAVYLCAESDPAVTALIQTGEKSGASLAVLDAHGAVLMPAFVDMHAHFRDPGFTEKEDVGSASRAAAAGGYGTVVLMANTNPVISDQHAAEEVNARIRSLDLIDAFQSVSLTRNFDGEDTSGLGTLDCRAVPVATEDGHEVASAAVMLEAMKKCSVNGVIVSCHCEDPDLAAAARPFRRSDPVAAERLLRLAEDTMTVRNLTLAAEAGCRVHIAHVSTEKSIDAVRRAKSEWRSRFPQYDDSSESAVSCQKNPAYSPILNVQCPVTCEVTPHHLVLDASLPEIVNPPLRLESDRAALLAGIRDGTVDVIATDHAPHTADDKARNAPGFSGIQTAFAVCNTFLVQTGQISLSLFSALMSANPARILGLGRGLLATGLDADFTLVDPDYEWTVNPNDPDSWKSRGKNTPFAGQTLKGRIIKTFKQGRLIFSISD